MSKATDPSTYVSARERTGSFGRFQLHPSHLVTSTGDGFSILDQSAVPPLYKATCAAARLQVCARAKDATDARDLLAVLGLIEGSVAA